MSKENDEFWMKKALFLSKEGRQWAPPNPWVGAALVKNNTLIGSGFTQAFGGAHAEVMALSGHQGADATLYVTLEPCSHYGKTPPCVDKIIASGVKRVVIGVLDPDPLVSGQGKQKLIEANIEVVTDVLKEAVEEELAPYLWHRKTETPFVVAKAAITLDGKMARADGSSKWISCQEARGDAHQLRANSQAILIGYQTALQDLPTLNARIKSVTKQPLRICIDPHGVVKEGPLLNTKELTTLFVTHKNTPLISFWKARGCDVFEMDNTYDLQTLLLFLGKKGVLQLMVEGGAKTIEHFFQQQQVNRLQLYIGPKVFGPHGQPLWTREAEANFKLIETQRLNQSVKCVYKIK